MLKKYARYCGDGQVENALLKKALNGDTTAMIFWLKKQTTERMERYRYRRRKHYGEIRLRDYRKRS